MSSRARGIDLDWPVSAAALVVAGLSAFLLARPAVLRPVGWTPPTAAAGTLSFNVGEVRRRPAGSLVWYSAERGDTVFVGDALFVSPHASATVALEGGAQLELDQNTLVVLEPPGADRAQPRRVAVRKGTISGTSGESPLQVEAAGAVAAISPRGQADVSVLDGAAEVSVRQGTVSLQSEDSRRELGHAQVGRVGPQGQVAVAARTPITLLAPAARQRVLAAEPVAFSWEGAAAGATLELATDRAFASPVKPDGAASPATRSLAPGVYWWRVRDAEGRALSEARPLTVLANVPPRLLSPSPGDRFDSPSVSLRWAPVEGASGYEVEVARDPAFTDTVLRSGEPGTERRWEEAADGLFFWRARARVAGSEGRWSEPSQFQVVLTPLPAAPILSAPEIEVQRRDAGTL